MPKVPKGRRRESQEGYLLKRRGERGQRAGSLPGELGTVEHELRFRGDSLALKNEQKTQREPLTRLFQLPVYN